MPFDWAVGLTHRASIDCHQQLIRVVPAPVTGCWAISSVRQIYKFALNRKKTRGSSPSPATGPAAGSGGATLTSPQSRKSLSQRHSLAPPTVFLAGFEPFVAALRIRYLIKHDRAVLGANWVEYRADSTTLRTPAQDEPGGQYHPQFHVVSPRLFGQRSTLTTTIPRTMSRGVHDIIADFWLGQRAGRS